MKTIYKYNLDLRDWTELALPKGAEVLHFDIQRNLPRIWALVDPLAEPEVRKFRLAGTGHVIKQSREDLRYIGTTLMMEGKFVWHLFEVLKEEE